MVSNTTFDRKIEAWEDYLRWRYQILLEHYSGIKCATAEYDRSRCFWNVLIVAPTDEKLTIFLRSISKNNEYEIIPTDVSEDRWIWAPCKEAYDSRANRNVGRLYDVIWKKTMEQITKADLSDFNHSEGLNTFFSDLLDINPDAMLCLCKFEPARKNQIYAARKPVIAEGFLASPQVAELVLIERQTNALQMLKDGKGTTPNIRNWIFDIQKARPPIVTEYSEIDWKNQSLNSDQQIAVRKAMLCPDVCLIQGPPGTGKTTVISEIVYQTVCRGKRVLIASQTHAAVDNAMERLVTDPSVRAVRLGKIEKINEAVYPITEDYAFQSFYESISRTLKAKFLDSNTSQEDQISVFAKDLSDIYTVKEQIENIDKRLQSAAEQIASISLEQKKLPDQFEDDYRNTLSLQRQIMVIDVLQRVLTYDDKTIFLIFDADVLAQFNMALKQFPQYNELELKEMCQINTYSDSVSLYMADLEMNDLIHAALDNKKNSSDGLFNIIGRAASEIKESLQEQLRSQRTIEAAQKSLDTAYSSAIQSYDSLQDEKQTLQQLLIPYAEKYHTNPENLISTIQDKKAKFEELRFGTDNLLKKDWTAIAKEMVAMLDDPSVVEADQFIFQQDYINACNVVGVSCTENSRTLTDRGFKDFDLVIIDEISKATLPEMLIPLLKGKRAVLVGDHRQLPPVFNVDTEMSPEERAFNPEKAHRIDQLLAKENKDLYKELVTTSMFEQWFKQADVRIRQRLSFQYRMHSDISNLVNRFYDFQLKDGLTSTQEETVKSHGLTISGIDHETIIRPDCHAYWFDSSYNVERRPCYSVRLKGSPSRVNFYEIKAVLKLLDEIENAYWKTGCIEEPISIGVISFYKDQIQEIDHKVKQHHYRMINVEVSTVDAFQGKEKQIILVSMVYNTPDKKSTEFMRQFERINVAFSRAQNMLAIFGAADLFREQKVYLPNMDSEGGAEKKIYNNIIQRLQAENALFPCWELLGE